MFNTAIRLRVILVTACLVLVSCAADQSSPDAEARPEAEAAGKDRQMTMEKWSRSCALCHVNGEGGAPRIGETEAWAPRLDQGEEVLLRRIIEGYNNMPPLGYCMDCSRQEFLELTRLMAGES